VHKVLTSEVWAVEVSDNGAGVVVVFFNQALIKENISINFVDIGLTGDNVSARDLVNKVDLGNFQTSFTAEVLSHGSVVIKFRNNDSIKL